MQAKDVMTVNVVTTRPDATIEEVAEQLLARGISAMPVVDGAGKVVGLVSEGDLVHRQAGKGARSWWLRFLASDAEDDARDFTKRHGHRVEDVMTKRVLSVEETTSLGDIASLLERHRIKRVPVLSGGKLVGIVSRANLLQGLAAGKDALTEGATPSDAEIRTRALALLDEGWVTHGDLNVTVSGGNVELWGWVESEDEAHAIKVAVEEIPGVKQVEAHLARYPYGP